MAEVAEEAEKMNLIKKRVAKEQVKSETIVF